MTPKLLTVEYRGHKVQLVEQVPGTNNAGVQTVTTAGGAKVYDHHKLVFEVVGEPLPPFKIEEAPQP